MNVIGTFQLALTIDVAMLPYKLTGHDDTFYSMMTVGKLNVIKLLPGCLPKLDQLLV